jgi:hypothetical protein
MRRSIASRLLDFLGYLAISVLVVGFTIIVAIRVSQPELASQLAVAFFTGCFIVAYIVQSYRRRTEKQALLLFCSGFLVIHFALYLSVFVFLGRTKTITAGLLTAIECAVVWWIGAKLVSRTNGG